jgi:hypothetical protein
MQGFSGLSSAGRSGRGEIRQIAHGHNPADCATFSN